MAARLFGHYVVGGRLSGMLRPRRAQSDARRRKGVCFVATFKNKSVIVVGEDYSQNSNDVREAACGFANTLAEAAIHLVHVARSNEPQYFATLTQRPAAPAD